MNFTILVPLENSKIRVEMRYHIGGVNKRHWLLATIRAVKTINDLVVTNRVMFMSNYSNTHVTVGSRTCTSLVNNISER